MSRIASEGGSFFKVNVYRNDALLRLAKDAPHCMSCLVPNWGDVVSAHSNQLRDGKGRGLKASDYRVAFMCNTCHSRLDQGRDMDREQRVQMWEDAHRETIGWLFESGHLEVKL